MTPSRHLPPFIAGWIRKYGLLVVASLLAMSSLLLLWSHYGNRPEQTETARVAQTPQKTVRETDDRRVNDQAAKPTTETTDASAQAAEPDVENDPTVVPPEPSITSETPPSPPEVVQQEQPSNTGPSPQEIETVRAQRATLESDITFADQRIAESAATLDATMQWLNAAAEAGDTARMGELEAEIAHVTVTLDLERQNAESLRAQLNALPLW